MGRAADGEAGRDPPDQPRLRQLAGERAALRRVATLVARGAAPEKVFAAVAEEVGQLFPVDLATMCRYEPGRTLTSVAAWGAGVAGFPVGSRWSLGGKNIATLVFETARPARVDSYADASGPIGVAARDRIEALGGTLHVTSPAGGGTTLLIEIPVKGQDDPAEPEP